MKTAVNLFLKKILILVFLNSYSTSFAISDRTYELSGKSLFPKAFYDHFYHHDRAKWKLLASQCQVKISFKDNVVDHLSVSGVAHVKLGMGKSGWMQSSYVPNVVPINAKIEKFHSFTSYDVKPNSFSNGYSIITHNVPSSLAFMENAKSLALNLKFDEGKLVSFSLEHQGESNDLFGKTEFICGERELLLGMFYPPYL